MPLDTCLTIAGAISALLLIAGLVASIAARGDEDAWRVWPVPPVRSLKSFIFWTLFRTLNVIVLLLAAERALALAVAGALPPIRLLLLIVSFAAFDAYLYALWALGREATYCRASGLATGAFTGGPATRSTRRPSRHSRRSGSRSGCCRHRRSRRRSLSSTL
jgi:hypothetical protein